MKRTPLYDRHIRLGARIIDFGGWDMPVQYTTVIEEHKATRQAAGLFDICHMGEIDVKGSGAFDFLQIVMSRNLEGQKEGTMRLSVMTTEQGGVIDDLTIYLIEDNWYRIVTNAGTKDKDLAWMVKLKDKRGFTGVEIVDMSDAIGKVDIQGPESHAVLAPLVRDDVTSLKYYHFIETVIEDIPVLVSRSGYTGEDGFEIYGDADNIGEVWDTLLAAGADRGLLPVGLGARDTLRLESGFMLYGNDMDETTTPLEVTYGWVSNLEKDFVGSDILRKQREEGVKKKLVGFEMLDRGIARHGYKVFKDGSEVGEVTSGTFAPTVGKAIGMAFVPPSLKEPGTEIDIHIRSKSAKAKIVGIPFYKRKKT
ncbi:MAG: glycine cleavage system aminomethyltransferase GcvT [Deltaproteobacteria bacterium]|nr:glycine cleavage system aminomethyltransferase GcvT [Deltaproteobacteria bacterium]MBN2687207.1 glycine cleavage system aminomethyltransferase GcvT [Deltaproteobacteria bacterium]